MRIIIGLREICRITRTAAYPKARIYPYWLKIPTFSRHTGESRYLMGINQEDPGLRRDEVKLNFYA